jgi:hypothetical protein
MASVRFHDVVEVGLQVEDATGIDAAFQDVVQELRDVGGRRATPPRNTMLRNTRVSTIGASTALSPVVSYDSTRLLKPWIPQAPSRIVNTISPP